MNAANRKMNIPERPARKRQILRVLLPVVIVAVGVAGAFFLKQTGPRPTRKPPVPIVALVQTETLARTREQVTVYAMGTVVPAREVTLKSRVSGEVIGLHPEFVEGGLLSAGEEVLQLDPQDYELMVRQKQSQVADADYGMKVEQGYQDVAKREWALLGGADDAGAADEELALRKPHLRKARADLSAAQAELAQARLDLARTRIHAPFNAVVQTRSVDVGSQVSPQDTVAELVGTDAYWIQVSVPVDRLAWIAVPRRSGETGAAVTIRYGGGRWTREGRVIKLLGDLEPDGRMARLLIAVEDPLDLSEKAANDRIARPPLLIGEYVSAQIEGAAVADVFRIPRTALRDDDQVWMAAPDDTLAIRKVSPLWRGGDMVLVTDGLKEGERLIISDLPAPVAGMPIRIAAAEGNSDMRLSESSGTE